MKVTCKKHRKSGKKPEKTSKPAKKQPKSGKKPIKNQ